LHAKLVPRRISRSRWRYTRRRRLDTTLRCDGASIRDRWDVGLLLLLICPPRGLHDTPDSWFVDFRGRAVHAKRAILLGMGACGKYHLRSAERKQGKQERERAGLHHLAC
jgi:hypothetical protein